MSCSYIVLNQRIHQLYNNDARDSIFASIVDPKSWKNLNCPQKDIDSIVKYVTTSRPNNLASLAEAELSGDKSEMLTWVEIMERSDRVQLYAAARCIAAPKYERCNDVRANSCKNS